MRQNRHCLSNANILVSASVICNEKIKTSVLAQKDLIGQALFNTLTSGLISAVRKKTAESYVAVPRNISALFQVTDLVEVSKDAAGLVVCTCKKMFVGGCRFFVSDVISGGLLDHLGQLHLPWAPTVRW